MNISDDLLCLYSATVDENGDSYTVEIPKRELRQGDIEPDDVYRIALIATDSESTETTETTERQASTTHDDSPPVEEGEIREVEIEDIGDGIGRIGPGYIVFVSGTSVGDRVQIRLTDVRENFAFGEVIGRIQN